jgi:uncharacterized protein (DUF427 family)
MPESDHPLTITDNPHRVRVLVGGAIVAESTRAVTLKEGSYPPVLYIPREDVQMDYFDKTERTSRCPHKGDASYYGVMAHGIETPDVAWSYENPLPGAERIRGHLAFYPNKVDAIEELK